MANQPPRFVVPHALDVGEIPLLPVHISNCIARRVDGSRTLSTSHTLPRAPVPCLELTQRSHGSTEA